MQDYIKRLLIAGLMALCISLLFIGGKQTQAEMLDIPELTSDWFWPAEGVVTDLYGTRHGHHKGIDIAGEVKTPVHSVDKGIVTKSYYSGSYGNVVFIKHDNNLETVYAHLNKRNVKEGQLVNQGDIIGLMGNTGDSSGVHLHFEIHKEKWTYKKENAIDPVMALGEAAIGQPVVAFGKKEHQITLETAGNLRMTEGNVFAEHTPEKVNGQHSIESAEAPVEIKHIVQKGETLWSIAGQYNISLEAIKQKNNINGNRIVPGDILSIEKLVKNSYIVTAGDTLHSIAKKTKTSVDELKTLNNLKSDTIKPQQILITR